jgi:nucleotide-binding universal stress UspA family protein
MEQSVLSFHAEVIVYERIVIPLDGTEFGEYAIRFATAVAHRSGAALDLVHVHIPTHLEPELFEVPVFHYTGVVRSDDRYDLDHLTAERDRIEKRATQLAEETGLQVSGRVVVGTVDREVEREAAAFGADLIVMSTHARTGLDRIRFGSVGDAVVRQATVPVLLVHPPEPKSDPEPVPDFKRVLVPLDGSEFSESIIGAASGLARSFEAELHLLHVMVPPELNSFHRDIHDDDGHVTTVEFTADAYLRYVAAEYASEVENPVLEVMRADSAIVGILKAATVSDSDVIAMATHGRGGLRRVLMGSTAGDVLCNAGLPVLLYRPHQFGMFGPATADVLAGRTVV